MPKAAGQTIGATGAGSNSDHNGLFAAVYPRLHKSTHSRAPLAPQGKHMSQQEPSGTAGDVMASINYRRHNGLRQSSTDHNGDKFVMSVKKLIRDARSLPTPPTVQSMGFALRRQPTDMALQEFYDDAQVTAKYYPLCEEVVKAETGAAAAKCFHHALRGQGQQPFAGLAHCDYSVKTAFDLISVIRPDDIDVKTFKGRMCVMNVWRNINAGDVPFSFPLYHVPLDCTVGDSPPPQTNGQSWTDTACPAARRTCSARHPSARCFEVRLQTFPVYVSDYNQPCAHWICAAKAPCCVPIMQNCVVDDP